MSAPESVVTCPRCARPLDATPWLRPRPGARTEALELPCRARGCGWRGEVQVEAAEISARWLLVEQAAAVARERAQQARVGL